MLPEIVSSVHEDVLEPVSGKNVQKVYNKNDKYVKARVYLPERNFEADAK
jgi:hypothetical protein